MTPVFHVGIIVRSVEDAMTDLTAAEFELRATHGFADLLHPR